MVTKTIFNPIFPAVLVGAALVLLFVAIIGLMIRRRNDLFEILFTGIRLLLLFAVIFVINLRPMRAQAHIEVMRKNLDIIFVIDTTVSMWAEDYGNGTRMDGVKEICYYMMQELPGANFATVVFDNSGRVVAPFTQDADTVADVLELIAPPDSYYASGSDFSCAYEPVEEMLISSSEKEGRRTYLYFFSDGENTTEKELPDFSPLADYLDGGAVLGVGTTEGGRMKEPGADYVSGGFSIFGGYIEDPTTGDDALSVLDEENLRLFAEQFEIEYRHITTRSDIDREIFALDNVATEIPTESNELDYRDLYPYIVPVAFVLMLISMVRFLRYGRL